MSISIDDADRIHGYQKTNTMVHIVKHGGRWFNGTIKKVGEDYLILIDRKIGPMTFFFMEIANIKPYTPKEASW